MPSWTVDVARVETLNEGLKRIVAGDIVVDLLTRFLDFDPDERINLVLEHDSTKVKGTVCLRGIVLASQETLSIVSCGGLMCRVPLTIPVNDTVFIGVTKSRRRRRG